MEVCPRAGVGIWEEASMFPWGGGEDVNMEGAGAGEVGQSGQKFVAEAHSRQQVGDGYEQL